MGTYASDVRLSDEQKRILDAVMGGRNIFYTGPAGTGKSFMLEYIVNSLKKQSKIIYLTAPTGINDTIILL